MGLINYVTRVQFGFGKLATLQHELALAGISRPFVVTDNGVRAFGLLDKVRSALGAEPVGIYDETPANPNEAATRAAAEAFNAAGPDGIVAIGGVSALNLAKGAEILAAHGGALRNYALIEGGVENPDDQEALADMAIAATMGAMAFQKGLGCVHSLSNARGGIDPTLHHGILNDMFMPAV